MTPDERRDWFERQVEGLLKDGVDIRLELGDVTSKLEEREKETERYRQRNDDALKGKAEKTDLTPIIQRLDRLDTRLGGTNKLLVGLLVSITMAAIVFGLAALQFAGGAHP